MARILFTWELGANRGHWAHIRPIAEGLAHAGHDVYAALRKVDVITRSWNSHLPLILLQAPHLSAPLPSRMGNVRSFANVLHNVGFYDTDVLAATITAWQNLYALVRPDIICFEHSPTALVAARHLDCKRVIIGDGFCSPPSIFPMPDLQPWLPSVSEGLMQDEQQVLERTNSVLDRQNTPSLQQLSQLYEEVDESFLLTFPELDHYGLRSGQRYWGTWSIGGTASAAWRSEGKRYKVFAYLKMFPGISDLFHQLSQFNCEVIAYVPDCDPDIVQSLQGSAVNFAMQPVDIATIGQECDLAILNANSSTAASFLLLGVPSLNFPLYVEQGLTAYRLAQANLGTTCHAGHSASFAELLEGTLTDVEMRNAASAFAKRYANFDAQISLNSIIQRIDDLT